MSVHIIQATRNNQDYLRGGELLAALSAMDLQWFAAEDEGRTEDPTEHKIRKAREEGRVAKSPDLTGSVVLLFTGVALLILGPGIMESIVNMVRFFFIQASHHDVTTSNDMALASGIYFLQMTVPILAVGMIGAMVGEIIQVGFLFTTKPLKPDIKRIVPNLSQYFKRSFGSIEALYNLAKSFIKVAIISGISTAIILSNWNRLLNTTRKTFYEGFLFIAEITMLIVMMSAVVLLALSFFDWWFQRRQHKESLMMTPQEVKQERKEYDGDPLVKGRMRQRMRQILTQNMMAALPKADVVVTNPTHFAIALEYKTKSMEAPVVLAKGQDEIALQIRKKATELGIPIIENKPLARALYAEVDIGATIPPKFYEAVVVVLKQVYRMKKREKEAV